MKEIIFTIAINLVFSGCTSTGHNAESKSLEKDSVALTPGSEHIRNFFSKDGELTWNEIANMDSLESNRL